jgi:hypothetical protein
MALFRVERRAGDMTPEDLDAAGFRSWACLRSFPELRWLRSYYDPAARVSHCYYETDEPDKIGEHARVADIACDTITEVMEFTPEMWAGVDPLVLKAKYS